MSAAGSVSWRESAEQLDALSSAVRSHAEELASRRAAAGQAIRDRDDLRGLLESFRAMAIRRGVIESDGVMSADCRAHDTLYEAPTDLAAAQALVMAVRAAVESCPDGPGEVA